MTLDRRQWLQVSGLAASAGLAGQARAGSEPAPASIAALQPLTEGVAPIGLDERRARLARAQKLMAERGLEALVLGPGSSLEYFTGAEWGVSERFFGAVVTRAGEPAWVVPAFERARGLEQIRLGGDLRAWEEHESPYALLAGILKDRGALSGRVGLDETLDFVFADGLAQAAPAARLVSGTPVTAGCRVIKDAHELQLMRRACEITLRAHRAVFEALRPGLTQEQASALSAEAHQRLGVRGGALVLFGADAAFPHGTARPQPLKAGDLVLIDGGGRLHGYRSDVTRTGVFGAPATPRQRLVWDLVRRAQEAAFRAARPGVECQALDAAARRVIDEAGFGPGYRCFTHRLGHGIGLDGHEWAYLVQGNATPLQPGMCFTNEPGVYLPGELGVRHEDVVTITDSGAECLSKWPGTIDQPVVL